MKKLKLRRVLASTLIAASVLALNPIGASAEWRKNNTGWWYAEGSSWATGWRIYDGKRYYFDSKGYMAHNTVVDNFYIGSDGSAVPLKNSDIPIKMPQGWSKISDDTYACSKAAIGYGTKETKGQSQEDITDAIKQGLSSGYSESKTMEKKYHGYDATCFEFGMTKDSVAIKIYGVVILKDKVAHIFTFASEVNDYNAYKQQFEDLLNSTLSL